MMGKTRWQEAIASKVREAGRNDALLLFIQSGTQALEYFCWAWGRGFPPSLSAHDCGCEGTRCRKALSSFLFRVMDCNLQLWTKSNKQPKSPFPLWVSSCQAIYLSVRNETRTHGHFCFVVRHFPDVRLTQKASWEEIHSMALSQHLWDWSRRMANLISTQTA